MRARALLLLLSPFLLAFTYGDAPYDASGNLSLPPYVSGGTWATRPTTPVNSMNYISSDTDCTGAPSNVAHQCRFSTATGAWGDLNSGGATTPTLAQAAAQGAEISGAICGVNPVIVSSPDGTVGAQMCYNPTYGPVFTLFPANAQLILVGEVYMSGISEDGTGKVVCIKSDKTQGTCAASSIGVSTCTCN